MSASYSPLPFFSHSPASAVIDTLSLHDALPISEGNFDDRALAGERGANGGAHHGGLGDGRVFDTAGTKLVEEDRKSTRLNSSHLVISYAVFCLKKKKQHGKNKAKLS